MSTKAYYTHEEIGKGKPGFSKTRSIIEAAFYGNNVVEVKDLKQAYELAKNSPGTIVTPITLPSPSGVYQSGSHTAPSVAKLPVSVRKLPDTSPL